MSKNKPTDRFEFKTTFKKWEKFNGFQSFAWSFTSFKKSLTFKLKCSEFDLDKALRTGKARITGIL